MRTQIKVFSWGEGAGEISCLFTQLRFSRHVTRLFCSYSNVNAIASPAVMWNSVFDHTGLNSVIGGAPFPPLVAAGGQDPLPWLRKVVVLPATALNLNRFPAGLCVPGPLCWITPFSGYNEVII